MEKHLYDIWLQALLKSDLERIQPLMTYYGGSENIFTADEQSLRASQLLTASEVKRALDKNLNEARQIYQTAVKNGIGMVAFDDENYPAMLRHISKPPVVLYYKGQWPDMTGLKVSVVGTRGPTSYGEKTAYNFAYGLAQNKALIVSGGACGIDCYAHKGAIQAGGLTVCVLGHGILYEYRNGAEQIRNSIPQHGMLLSEYPPEEPAMPFRFSKRNRIIAGLTDCTLVVEAGTNSGALITAGEAAEQGKTIFAVPGSPLSGKSLGTNNLIRMGAETALSYQDLLHWHQARSQGTRSSGTPITKEMVEDIRKKTVPLPFCWREPVHEQITFSTLEADPPLHQQENSMEDTPSAVSGGTTPKVSEQPSAVSGGTMPKVSEQPSAVSGGTTPEPSDRMEEKPEMEKNMPLSVQKKDKSNKIPENLLTAEALSVYDTISESPTDAMTIAQSIGMSVRCVQMSLTELELLELIKPVSFGRFVRK